jgi:hypothetical protein
LLCRSFGFDPAFDFGHREGINDVGFCHLPPTKHNEDIGSAISIEKRKVNTVQDSFGFYKNKRQVSGVIMLSWAYCQAGV